MDLSIIIPVYNAERLINRTLDSIFEQHTNYTYEVICVDDGSTDNSVDIIRSRNDDRIHIIQQKNSGPSAARNRGIEVAIGKYLAFLDSDDYWSDGFIEQTVTFLQSNSECIAVSVGQRHLTISGNSISPSCIDNFDSSVKLNDFFDFWSKYNHVCVGSVTIRNEIIKSIGGFREDLLCNEDWELWAMLGACGKWGFIPKILFTSDGIDVSRSIGWLQKMKPRWYNAQSVEFWESRILSHFPSIVKNEGYIKKAGIIASDIAYSLLLSDRNEQSRNTVKKYGKYFEDNNLNKIFKFCAKSKLLWNIMCGILKFREYHRTI